MSSEEAEACHNNRGLAEEAHKGSFVVACVGEALCMVRMVQEGDEEPLGLADDVVVAVDVVVEVEEHKDQYPAEESR